MWEIKNYEQNYFQDMMEMTREYYGAENDISDSGFIKHEYFSNPAGDAFIKLAFDDEKQRLAGQYIVIPREYMVIGNKVRCVLSLNTLTRADYRGQQVFTNLAEAVYEECAKQKRLFCYGAPNQNSFHGFIKKLEFQNAGEMPLYLKIIRPGRLLCEKLGILCQRSEKKKIISCRPCTRRKSKMNIVHISEKNVGLFDTFWEEIKMKYSVMGVRDANYMKWRYLNIPLRDYCIFMAVENGLPCGYVIGRVSEVAGMKCGMIVDFLVRTGRKDIAKLLLDNIIKYFNSYKTGLLGCLMKRETEEARYLSEKGFFICPKKLLPQPFPIIYRQFCHFPKKEEQALKDFSRWFFTMGDYDVI